MNKALVSIFTGLWLFSASGFAQVRELPAPVQLRVALIELALFDAIDELLDLGRICGGDIIVVFHGRRSRRSYARENERR